MKSLLPFLILVLTFALLPACSPSQDQVDKAVEKEMKKREEEKTRIFKVIETALDVYESKTRKIPTSKLNEVMLKAIEAYHAPVVRGHSVKIKFVTQLPTHVPSFAFFCNFPDDIKTPYKNYLENQLRSNFNFSGVPVRLFFRKK